MVKSMTWMISYRTLKKNNNTHLAKHFENKMFEGLTQLESWGTRLVHNFQGIIPSCPILQEVRPPFPTRYCSSWNGSKFLYSHGHCDPGGDRGLGRCVSMKRGALSSASHRHCWNSISNNCWSLTLLIHGLLLLEGQISSLGSYVCCLTIKLMILIFATFLHNHSDKNAIECA